MSALDDELAHVSAEAIRARIERDRAIDLLADVLAEACTVKLRGVEQIGHFYQAPYEEAFAYFEITRAELPAPEYWAAVRAKKAAVSK